MISSDEKLVLEGGKVKQLTMARELESHIGGQGGVIIDYLRFTVLKASMFQTKNMPSDTSPENACYIMASKFAELLGYSLGDVRPGRDYYEHTVTVINTFGQEIASVSGGGESQRDTYCFTLKGEGCTYARHGWEKSVSEFFAPLNPKITRIDLARDTFDNHAITIECAILAYKDNRFSYQNRKPSYRLIGCTLEGETQHSRTFQVGKRESGKLIRVYEKAHQFGMMSDPWVRAEVELRSVNRVIPWDCLTKPGDYFAGAYEWCNWLVHQGMSHLDQKRIKTQTKVAEASVEKAMRWVARVVAPTLVQITSAMPDFDWLQNLVIDNAQRRVPRALRGLNHHAVKQGLDKWFDRINPNGNPNPSENFFNPGFAAAV
ncbi:MAG: replication initiation factor domain-containing protein [Polaromonas sp.]